MIDRPEELVWMYWRVKVPPLEGTIAEAIKAHSQACGFVAFACDVHPDQVAQAVAEVTRDEMR